MLKILLPLLSLTLVAQAPVPPSPRPMPPRMPGMSQNMMPGAPEPKDDEVIAYLGKRTIHYSDFSKWLGLMAGPRAAQIRKSAASRGQAMKQYLDIQVCAAKGKREKLEALPEFKATMAAVTQQVYTKILMDEERAGSDAMKAKEQAEHPSDLEILAYFKANSERFATPEKFSARHILVSLKPAGGGKALTEEEAKARVAKIQEELKAGKKLQDLSSEYSDDPGSKAKGGLYEDIPYGRFAKEFEEAVRKQDIGVVGEPVKTTFGYHLIQVVSRSPKQTAEFDKVKDTVRQQMLPERREKAKKAYMEQIRKEVGFREPEPKPQPTPAPMAHPAAAPAPAPAAAPAPAPKG
jgi:hypothetical protein